jgi:hypothetical protein
MALVVGLPMVTVRLIKRWNVSGIVYPKIEKER